MSEPGPVSSSGTPADDDVCPRCNGRGREMNAEVQIGAPSCLACFGTGKKENPMTASNECSEPNPDGRAPCCRPLGHHVLTEHWNGTDSWPHQPGPTSPSGTPADGSRRRNRYLLTTEVDLLRAWGRDLARLFDEGPYLVGSALQRQDWRDVDVRIMLDDDRFDALVAITNPRLLNLALSLWGQKVTGLPIDCQVQRVTDANAEFDGPRDPLHLPADALDPWRPTPTEEAR